MHSIAEKMHHVAHCKNLNEERPIQSVEKMYANDTSFSKYKVHVDIRGVPRGEASNDSGDVDDRNFWQFWQLLLLKLLEIRPALLHVDNSLRLLYVVVVSPS